MEKIGVDPEGYAIGSHSARGWGYDCGEGANRGAFDQAARQLAQRREPTVVASFIPFTPLLGANESGRLQISHSPLGAAQADAGLAREEAQRDAHEVAVTLRDAYAQTRQIEEFDVGTQQLHAREPAIAALLARFAIGDVQAR